MNLAERRLYNILRLQILNDRILDRLEYNYPAHIYDEDSRKALVVLDLTDERQKALYESFIKDLANGQPRRKRD